jgi:hypothetical protein
MIFCNAFKLDPSLRTFDLTSGQLDPYLKDLPTNGADRIDLETRSLLQVLFFVSQGVDVPAAHLTSGVAPCTSDLNGGLFDWQQVLGGLFRVHCSASKKAPPAPTPRSVTRITGSTSTNATATRRRPSRCS